MDYNVQFSLLWFSLNFSFTRLYYTCNEWFYQPLNIFVAGFWSIVEYMLNKVQNSVFSLVCILKFHLEFHTTQKLQINLCRKYFGQFLFSFSDFDYSLIFSNINIRSTSWACFVLIVCMIRFSQVLNQVEQ